VSKKREDELNVCWHAAYEELKHTECDDPNVLNRIQEAAYRLGVWSGYREAMREVEREKAAK